MTNDLLLFIAIGFAAQMDGAIGMAYGITATTALLSMRVAPSAASAAIHMAEVFTTAASGAAHWRMGKRRSPAGRATCGAGRGRRRGRGLRACNGAWRPDTPDRKRVPARYGRTGPMARIPETPRETAV